MARRTLAPGHFAGSEYPIELRLRPFNPDREILRIDQQTLGGASERMYLGAVRSWSLTTVSTTSAFAPFVREFLHSTEDGQPFTADLYGQIALPDEPLIVYRTDTRAIEERTIQQGNGGRADFFRFSFSIREQL